MEVCVNHVKRHTEVQACHCITIKHVSSAACEIIDCKSAPAVAVLLCLLKLLLSVFLLNSVYICWFCKAWGPQLKLQDFLVWYSDNVSSSRITSACYLVLDFVYWGCEFFFFFFATSLRWIFNLICSFQWFYRHI